jgi:hypothetical protein
MQATCSVNIKILNIIPIKTEYKVHNVFHYVICFSNFLLNLWQVKIYFSSLGSTAQLRPWPPPQNPAEFCGHFSTIFLFYRVGLLARRPTPIPEVQASVFISPRGRVATHFSRLLRHAWVTVGLFLFSGHHTWKDIFFRTSYSSISWSSSDLKPRFTPIQSTRKIMPLHSLIFRF